MKNKKIIDYAKLYSSINFRSYEDRRRERRDILIGIILALIIFFIGIVLGVALK